jgi:PleD family two-component response regulator
MSAASLPRRVLIVAPSESVAELVLLFAGGPLFGWEAVYASSVAQACFVLQHEACDALLLDEALYRREGLSGLTWLVGQREAPVVFLAGPVPELITEALDHGVQSWLPRETALRQPRLLTTALDQAARTSGLRRRLRVACEALHACRQQVSRLVNLLWETEPTAGASPWLSQRGVLERLREETARAERHGGPFALALGEVRAPGAPEGQGDDERLASWTAEQLARVKRRSDVAGRYGPHGFLMLFMQTPEERAALGCQRVQQALEQAAAGHLKFGLRVDFGVAGFGPGSCTPKSLLSQAERRLEKTRASNLVRR